MRECCHQGLFPKKNNSGNAKFDFGAGRGCPFPTGEGSGEGAVPPTQKNFFF